MPGTRKHCFHGRELRRCKLCPGGGAAFCIHAVQKHRCKRCALHELRGHFGTSLCMHFKVRHQCSHCRRKPEAKTLCKCGIRLTRCSKCKDGGRPTKEQWANTESAPGLSDNTVESAPGLETASDAVASVSVQGSVQTHDLSGVPVDLTGGDAESDAKTTSDAGAHLPDVASASAQGSVQTHSLSRAPVDPIVHAESDSNSDCGRPSTAPTVSPERDRSMGADEPTPPYQLLADSTDTVLTLKRLEWNYYEAGLQSGVAWKGDEDMLRTLPQGEAKLATLLMQEKMIQQKRKSQSEHRAGTLFAPATPTTDGDITVAGEGQLDMHTPRRIIGTQCQPPRPAVALVEEDNRAAAPIVASTQPFQQLRYVDRG